MFNNNPENTTCSCESNGKCRCSSLSLPIVLLSLLITGWLGSELWRTTQERGYLQQAISTQEQQIQNVEKIKAQLNALLEGTQKLASNGNVEAVKITKRLKELGIINDAQVPNAVTPSSSSTPSR